MRCVEELQQRFGILDHAWDRLRTETAQETVFIGTPEVMSFREVQPMRKGIRLCRVFPFSVKPTTFAMQALGALATRNVITLNDGQTRKIINGHELSIDADVDNGFVLLKWKEFVIGVGLYKRPVLKSQVPRFRKVEE